MRVLNNISVRVREKEKKRKEKKRKIVIHFLSSIPLSFFFLSFFLSFFFFVQFKKKNNAGLTRFRLAVKRFSSSFVNTSFAFTVYIHKYNTQKIAHESNQLAPKQTQTASNKIIIIIIVIVIIMINRNFRRCLITGDR